MKQSTIIGIIGKAGSGKDHYAERFKTDSDEIVKITQEVILMVQNILKINLDEPNLYEEFKEREITDWGLTGRDIIRNTAETLKEKTKETYWIESLLKKISDYEDELRNIYITDVRFDYEAIEIIKYSERKDISCHFVFTDYRSEKYKNTSPHVSEKFSSFILDKSYKHEQIISTNEMKKIISDYKHNKWKYKL